MSTAVLAGAPMVERDPDRAVAAHLLRRTSPTLDLDRIDIIAGRAWDDVVGEIVDTARRDAAAVADGDDPVARAGNRDWTVTVEWWIERLLDPRAGLFDRMTWFWHTLLTTGAEKVSDEDLIADQLDILRSNALGDYRTLLYRFVTSGALLDYLDVSGSVASNPNENLGRELMELFTVGHGNYSQDDVRAASRAIAGWDVTDGEVEWRRDRAFVAPLVFRGIQDDWDTAKVVDHLCDDPATAANIGGRLWHFLVGTHLGAEQRTKLGRWWQEHDLEILDLVERVLTDPATIESRYSRPRTGIEWALAYHAATRRPVESLWELERFGQLPYAPPNVGGWPDGVRWLSPGSLLARSSAAFNIELETLGGDRSGTTDEILDRCGLFEVSESTLAAIDGVRSTDDLAPEGAYLTRWRLALSSPEFSLL